MNNLKEFLEKEGYKEIREIPGKGVCALYRFIFTVGLVYNIDEFGYEGRYCYPNYSDALEALLNWNGQEDPSGDWIKHKGKIEYLNKNKIQ